MPRLAKRWRFGVLMADLGSRSEMLSFISSMTMKRTFGLAASALIKVNDKVSRRSARIIMVVSFSVGCSEIVSTGKCTRGA